MSEIKTKSQNWPVASKEDVIGLYAGTETNETFADTASRIGMEVELNLYNTDTLEPLTEEQSKCLICEGQRNALSINNEPSASTLEVISEPHLPGNFGDLIEQINGRFDELWQIGSDHHTLPSPFAYLPHITPEEHHQTHNDRYIAFWGPPREDVVEAYHSFVDPSIQVSVSYRDYEHLLRIIRLSIALEPFLILTTEADAGFYEREQVGGSPRTRVLKRRGRNGGVPDFYYSAKTGEELIDRHIDFTLNNKHMFVCFNHDGQLAKLPGLEWASFLELEEKGYGPQNLLNYRQAQSMSWRRTVNISEIRDGEGTLFGHRAEISSLFCTGLQHQRATSAVISCLAAYCKHFYNNINELSKDFGIDLDNLEGTKDLLNQNFENAYAHEGRYFDLPFGTRTIKEFATGFAEISQECLKRWNLDQHSGPLMHILSEGRPDWLVNRELFQTLDQQKAYMRALPDLSAARPELKSAAQCADFTKEIVSGFLETVLAQ
ncbi:MAG: hypothetical protein KDJ35_05150 [Alphaproteobacteria bacterium]|nr:hypothetical protein [Alphaproteobacteria bacterium]